MVGTKEAEGEDVGSTAEMEEKRDAVGLGVNEPPSRVLDTNGVGVEEVNPEVEAPGVSVADPVTLVERVPPFITEGVASDVVVGADDKDTVATPLSVRVGILVMVRSPEFEGVRVDLGVNETPWRAVVVSEGASVRCGVTLVVILPLPVPAVEGEGSNVLVPELEEDTEAEPVIVGRGGV